MMNFQLIDILKSDGYDENKTYIKESEDDS